MNKKQTTIINFKQAKGLIEHIIKMIEENRYCVDIMQQNLAAIGLLKSAHQILFQNHLNTCVKKGIISKNPQRQKQLIQEIIQLTNLSNK